MVTRDWGLGIGDWGVVVGEVFTHAKVAKVAKVGKEDWLLETGERIAHAKVAEPRPSRGKDGKDCFL